MKSHPRQWVDTSDPSTNDLNNPPTTVGGIRGWLVRKDLNNPPTAVGGIHRLSLSGDVEKDLKNRPTAVVGIRRSHHRLRNSRATSSWVRPRISRDFRVSVRLMMFSNSAGISGSMAVRKPKPTRGVSARLSDLHEPFIPSLGAELFFKSKRSSLLIRLQTIARALPDPGCGRVLLSELLCQEES